MVREFKELDKKVRKCFLDKSKRNRDRIIKPGFCFELAKLLKKVRDKELFKSKYQSLERYFDSLQADRAALFALISIYENLIFNEDINWSWFLFLTANKQQKEEFFNLYDDVESRMNFIGRFLEQEIGWAKLKILLSLLNSQIKQTSSYHPTLSDTVVIVNDMSEWRKLITALRGSRRQLKEKVLKDGMPWLSRIADQNMERQYYSKQSHDLELKVERPINIIEEAVF